MTETLRILLTAGITFVAAALGSIVAPVLKAKYDAKLERHKALLARETRLYEKQSTIVAELFAHIRGVYGQLYNAFKGSLVEGEDRDFYRKDFARRNQEMINFFSINELYLPPEIVQTCRALIEAISQTRILIGYYDMPKAPTAETGWQQLSDKIFNELPPIVERAEEQCRKFVRSAV